MFKKNTWMSKGYIALAIRKLEEYENSTNEKTRDAAQEGLACLRNSKPEYLMNIIKADHPDRIAALRILEQS